MAGESISLSGATPATGWHISGWTGAANDSSTAGANSLTMPASARTVSVNYTQNEYTLTVNTVGSGTVARNPNQATYHYGDVVTLTATAATGWNFSAWSGDLSGAVNPATITITGDRVVTATFTEADNPAIQVIGTANVTEASMGEVVTYTYRVQNVGNMPLTSIQARDNRLGIISLGNTLSLGGMTSGALTYLVTASDVPGPMINVVTVTAMAGSYQVSDIYTITVQIKPDPSPSNTVIYLPIITKNAPIK